MMRKIYTSLLIVLVVSFVGSCDISGPEGTADQETPQFEVTNDLDERVTYLSGKGKAAAGNSNSIAVTQDLTLTGLAQVAAPTIEGNATRASHLSLDPSSGDVHVGYKIIGSPYGGGVDILSIPANINNTNVIDDFVTLGSRNFDVQEVSYSSEQDAIYVAGAVKPLDAGESGSRILKLGLSNIGTSGNVSLDGFVELSGNVAKSVDHNIDEKNLEHVWVVTDTDTLYEFGPDLGDMKSLPAPNSDVEFRSVVYNDVLSGDSQVLALDRDGTIHNVGYQNVVDEGSFAGSISTMSSGEIGELAISRLQDAQNGALVAALGDQGFSILAPGGGSVLWNSAEQAYTGYYVSATYDSDQGRIFAARANGSIQVFDVDASGEGVNFTLNSVTHVGEFDLEDVSNITAGTNQINKILTDGNYLYVANSTDGVVILEVDNSSS